VSEPLNDPIICFCNEVRLSVIVAALDEGASTLADIFDRTWAGCGPCGGSCQPDLVALLEDYLGHVEGDGSTPAAVVEEAG